jgi:MFS transporter, putative metabolite:H+ symporter
MNMESMPSVALESISISLSEEESIAQTSAVGASSKTAGRIERLPFSRWHVKLVAVVGLAHLMDSFDSLSIALVLPVIIPLWHLSPTDVGLLLSMGYVGQMVGAVGLSWLSERIGRIGALRLALGVMGIFSFLSAHAASYSMFVVLRAIQGLGLGGEVPVAATLVNELTPARYRGRVTGSLQCLFGTGILVTSTAAFWLVPTFGWQSLFYVGVLPAVLMCAIGVIVPESPRWLAQQGKIEQAERSLKRIEDSVSRGGKISLPPPALAIDGPTHSTGRLSDLFGPAYRTRTITVWVLMFCASTVGYALLAWMPTIYHTVYGYDLNQVFELSILAGAVSLIGAVTGVSMIDRAGRRATFMVGLFGCAVPLFLLSRLHETSTIVLISLVSVCNFFISIVLGSVHTYAAEIYPTRMRALGAGTAIAWLRVASIVMPLIVSALLTKASIGAVFLFIAAAATIGGITVALAVIETKGRTLEEIAT